MRRPHRMDVVHLLRNACAPLRACIPLALLLAAVCAGPLSAQERTVSGRVTDGHGSPIVGASVVVKGTMLGSATDLNGAFTIRKLRAGTWTLVVTMIGYARQERTITLGDGAPAAVDIALAESAIQTDEVVVTAGRRAQSFEEIPVSIALFEASDISARAITSLDDALRRIPGVNVTESTVNIRGSSGYAHALGSRVILLLDGVPVLAGDANEIKFDVVPMYAVERIEVVKGAGSALYGSSALGGVINVITRQPAQAVTRARLMTGFYDNPSYDAWKWWGRSPRLFHGVDLLHGDRQGAMSWQLAAGLHSSQGYRQTDDYLRWNVTGKGNWAITPDRNLGLSLNYAADDHGNWVYWRDLRHALIPPAAKDLGERLLSTKLQSTLQYRETVGTFFMHSARFSVLRTAYEMRSDTSDFSLRPSDGTQSTAFVYGAYWQGTASINTWTTLVGGTDLSLTTVRSRTYGDRDGYNAALYLQGEIKPWEALALSCGARFDLARVDTADADRQINPRFGVSYVPREGTILRASFGRGFRSPSISEKFATASSGGLVTRPNPSLRPEYSTSYECGIKQVLPGPVVLDAAAFVSEYEDLVEPRFDTSPGSAGRIYFDNITRARISGFEIGAMSPLFDNNLALSLSYTYMYPRDLSLGTMLKYRLRHLLYASGTWSFLDGTLGADFRYMGRMEEIDDALSLVVLNADQRVEAFITDLRCSWDFARLWLPLTVTFSVENLLNYNYCEIPGNLAPIRNFRLAVESSF